jgi:flagellar protein FlbB
MKVIFRIIMSTLVLLLVMFSFSASSEFGVQVKSRDCEAAGSAQAKDASRGRKPEAAPLETHGSREIIERESALNLKERELEKMSANLDFRMKELEEKRKSLESSIVVGNKVNDERYKKMLKLYKSLKPEEAAGLIDKLDEDTAFEMLNRMDTKTAAKLVPFLNQKMVLKWTRLTLKGN